MKRLLPFLTLLIAVPQALAGSCPFVPWTQYQGKQLYKHPSMAAYLFQTASVKIDADGAPNAYHPDDIKLHCLTGHGFKGLDCPANAGYPGTSWWRSALLPDPRNSQRAYVQPASSPYAGFFVSQTSLADGTKPVTDVARYVDSRNVPYLVFPGNFNAMKGTGVMGDFGYAMNVGTGQSSPFVVAEVGPPKAALGEMSMALAAALGGTNPNPRTGDGAPQGKIVYVVFPRSRATPAWPLTNAQIAIQAEQLLQSAGGMAVLNDCKSSP